MIIWIDNSMFPKPENNGWKCTFLQCVSAERWRTPMEYKQLNRRIRDECRNAKNNKKKIMNVKMKIWRWLTQIMNAKTKNHSRTYQSTTALKTNGNVILKPNKIKKMWTEYVLRIYMETIGVKALTLMIRTPIMLCRYSRNRESFRGKGS